jgi:hypothetical protein
MDDTKEKKIILNNDSYSISQNNYMNSFCSEISEENSIEKKEKNLKIICRKCAFFPLIEFINDNKFNITCQCKNIKNLIQYLKSIINNLYLIVMLIKKTYAQNVFRLHIRIIEP